MLEIHGLEKRFGDKKVLNGLDLRVPAHSVFGFLGRNGAGKTTTMKAVLGLLRPDAGEITVAGERVEYGRASTNRHIGYLPDVPELYGFLTAAEYLRFCGELDGMGKTEIKTRSAELLELVGLQNEKHRIGGYSRGMKQRLGIAQALLNKPALLLCDEPTSALDPVGRREILDILSAVREETTVLFSTHILSDAESICTDAALLNGGRIALQGSLSSLKSLGCFAYRIEPETENAASALMSHFPAMRREGRELYFSETEYGLFDVMSCISAQKLPVLRLERCERSLESLFWEVSE